MARTPFNDPNAEAIYQHGAGNARMPDSLQNLPYGVGDKSGAKTDTPPGTGHDQKMTKKNRFAPK